MHWGLGLCRAGEAVLGSCWLEVRKRVPCVTLLGGPTARSWGSRGMGGACF